MVCSYNSRFDLENAKFNGNVTFCSPTGLKKTLDMDCSALNTRIEKISLRSLFRESADPAVHLFLEDKPVINGDVESNDPINIGCASKVNLTDGSEHIISLALDNEIWLVDIRRLSTSESALAYNKVALPVLDEENKTSVLNAEIPAENKCNELIDSELMKNVSQSQILQDRNNPQVAKLLGKALLDWDILRKIATNVGRPITKASEDCGFNGDFIFIDCQRKLLVTLVKNERGLKFSLDVDYVNEVMQGSHRIDNPCWQFKINGVRCSAFGKKKRVISMLGSTRLEFDGISDFRINLKQKGENSENIYVIRRLMEGDGFTLWKCNVLLEPSSEYPAGD